MQYPRIVKSLNLNRVFENLPYRSADHWLACVNQVFGAAVAAHVDNVTPKNLSTCTINPLEWQVMEELGNILNASKNYWKFWTVELIERAIPKLVQACIWKNNILSEHSYLRDTVNRYATDGLEILSGLSDYLLLYSNDKKPSTRKALVTKYLEPPYQDGDARAILIRALRCFVTYRISKKTKSELLFKFTPDLRISLWGRTINKYLYEQLCLYIYLFRNPQEGHFFIEHRQQLINFVSARLPDDHQDLAEVIVGETFDYLIKRRNCYCATQDTVWIDTSLDTYFIGHILSSKRIQRFWEKRRKLEASRNIYGSEEDYPEDWITVRPKYRETYEHSVQAAEPNERAKLLKYYINRLDMPCKTYFQWEYFGNRTVKGAPLKQTEISTISTPCLTKLKTLLVNSGYYDLFVK